MKQHIEKLKEKKNLENKIKTRISK
jgi:hypothetical protein